METCTSGLGLGSGCNSPAYTTYQPAWQGGFLWDDDVHVTRPELRSWQGLYRTWFDVRATIQYYPVLHSAFWIEHKLWGDAPLGYHLVNLVLHAATALMAAGILRRLAVPGAYLAAAIFALHPVHAESVAWISEQKNTLSAVLYLAAAVAYLNFDQSRKVRWYLAAGGLFALAVLSKSVTATLPGALLLICWWRRGRLSWRRDVLPLLPLFLLGAGVGAITAWWELEVNKCAGPEFEFTALERLLLAGRAVCFHCGKLFWPTKLAFIYPRWQIDPHAVWQYLFPLGAILLLGAAWSVRRRSRGPLTALLFFAGTLFPSLGFFNLYTFRYALVANHYQYLASLGIITLFSAGAALLWKHRQFAGRLSGYGLCLGLLLVLAVLTWRQARIYAHSELLYQTTIEWNPDCWLAYNNLGADLADSGRGEEAIAAYLRALEIRPDLPDAHYNLGNILLGRGQLDAAMTHFDEALKSFPEYAKAHTSRGIVLAARGQVDAAIAAYGRALEINPNLAEAHNNLALALAGRGGINEALEHFQRAVEIRPDFADAHINLGAALAGCGRFDAAIGHFRKCLDVQPENVQARVNLGDALARCGRLDEALLHYHKALGVAMVRNDGALADTIRKRIERLQSAGRNGTVP